MFKYIFYFILFPSITHAQKTAYFNEKVVLNAIPDYERKLKETDSIRKSYVLRIKNMNEKLKAKTFKLIKPYNITGDITEEELLSILSEKDKGRFEIILQEQKLNNTIAQTLDKEMQIIYQEKVGVLIDEAYDVIKDYCENNKIDVLYKLEAFENSIGYINEKLDITIILQEAVSK